MLYTGSCHCGQTRYEIEGELGHVIECNCSYCRRKGPLMWFVPRDALKLHTPEDALATYRFNRHVIAHHFCPNCGCAPFGMGTDPSGNAMVAVNVRCLDDIDFAALEVMQYDGLHRN
ncbi:Uncharacterized conserved protein [Andreprevotia lacus DSM 23236]|uniref:Uncharacterized conserved protein n=2 Tax=Andreprevotia TaxID=397275 RepID=A0A1W1XGN9_9NEIS|nr:GFA family protein [Andreprevotia lacus]SMC22942.1 Uncharacterized conserved protein [Andreprevotia lacus DSM 23236]